MPEPPPAAAAAPAPMRTRNDPAWLEAQYNNRARVPDHAGHFARWQQASALVRSKTLAHLRLLNLYLDDSANARCVRGESGAIQHAGVGGPETMAFRRRQHRRELEGEIPWFAGRFPPCWSLRHSSG